jgi:hypothetical protein
MALKDLISILPGGDKIFNKISNNNLPNDINVSTELNKEKSVEDMLPFDTIIDNIIKVEKGKYRIISKTNAINLYDMDTEDQDTILSIFGEYVNGITRPFQIFIPSFKLDIRDYIQKLETRLEDEDDEEICSWIEDDIKHQNKLMQETDIIDTQFYIIHESNVRAENDTKDFIKAKKELYSQSKICSDELEGIGLVNSKLGYKDIGKLLYYSINPFSAGVQEPIFEDNQVINSEKVKTKIKPKFKIDGEQEETFSIENKETKYFKDGGISFKNKIAPYSINDKEDSNYVRVGSAYMTVYEIQDYPSTLSRLWPKKLYKFRDNIDVSIHIKPIQSSKVVRELNRAAIDYGSTLANPIDGKKKTAVTMIEKQMEASSESVSKTMDLLGSGDENFFHYSKLINVKARSIDELNDICLEVENILGSFCVFRKCTDNMKNALWSVLPIGMNLAASERDMLTSAVANAFPFTNFSYSHKSEEKQFFLGIQKNNQSLIHFNPFILDSYHYGILGRTGAGKGVVGKKIIKGITAIMDIPVRIIDPDGECSIPIYDFETKKETTFAKSLAAEVIDYYVGSKHHINVCDIEIDDESDSLIKPHINYMKVFLGYIFGGIEKADRNKIDASLIYLYNQKGFTDNIDTYWDDSIKDAAKDRFYLGRPRRRSPELIELLEIWENNILIDTIGDTKHLADMLREWTRKGTNDLFDGQTNVDFNNKRLVFNLSKLDKYVKVPVSFVLFHKLWDISRLNPTDYKLIHMFEAHVLLRDDIIGEYVNEIVKRLRKYGGAFGFDTQNVTDLLKTKYGPEIIKNCNWHILMKQDKNDVDILMEMHQMTRSEALKMTKFNPNKGEGYLIVDGFRIPINVSVSNKELQTFTTNPKDLKKMSLLKQADN